MQELCQFSFKINATPNGLEKYMRFNMNSMSVLIVSFQFLSFSLDFVVKNLGKIDFKYLSQEFNSEVLYLIRRKEFYPCKCRSGFESLKKSYKALNHLYFDKSMRGGVS